MKRKNFLVYVVSILLTLGLASCGSDNESNSENNVAAPAVTTAPTPAITSGLSTCEGSSSFEDFKNRVNEGRFVQELSQQETYIFDERELTVSESELFGWDWTRTKRYSYVSLGQFTRWSERGTNNANHEAGNSKEAVRNYLMQILNNATSHRLSQNSIGGKAYEVLSNTGMVYQINLCYPLVANPVVRGNQQTGDYYTFMYVGNGGFSTFPSF